MSETARVRANRENAKRSTGPRTVAGKKRVAANAIRHGLAIPISALPEAQGSVAVLTQLIAGDYSSPHQRDLAMRVAEAEMDVIRARRARHDLIQTPIDIFQGSPRLLGSRASKALAQGGDPDRQERWMLTILRMSDVISAYELLPITIAGRATELTRLDRYERRALSRRKHAIRAYDRYSPVTE